MVKEIIIDIVERINKNKEKTLGAIIGLLIGIMISRIGFLKLFLYLYVQL